MEETVIPVDSDSPSYQLFQLTLYSWPPPPVIHRKIELLLKAGADFNVPYYDGRQGEWTALENIVEYHHCFREQNADTAAWHEYLGTMLQLFLQYRGFEAFQEEDVLGDGMCCGICSKIIRRAILGPFRARKWLNFCASEPVQRWRKKSTLFESHLLGLIREYAEDEPLEPYKCWMCQK